MKHEQNLTANGLSGLEQPVDSTEFLKARKVLDKTQKQLAELLGISIKAVHSYEQGWRKVPTAVERQMYFLTVKQNTKMGKCFKLFILTNGVIEPLSKEISS